MLWLTLSVAYIDFEHRAQTCCLRFLKTASIVEKEPWELHRAAKSLRDWVDIPLVVWSFHYQQ